jgi:hypothetical protein
MSSFNTNLNAFNSSIQQIKPVVHSFTSSAVPKGSKNFRQQKRSLSNAITHAIDAIDTNDFGIRVIIIKTKD